MEIIINKQKFILKYTLRAFFIFESIAGYPFKFGKMLDEFILFYSFLFANNRDTFHIEFEEFIRLCEEDMTLYKQFKDFLLSEIQLRSQMTGNDVKKKKATEKKRKR